MSFDQEPNYKPSTFDAFGSSFIVFVLIMAGGAIILLANSSIKESESFLTKSLPTFIIAILGAGGTLIFKLLNENMSMKNEKYFDKKFEEVKTHFDEKLGETNLELKAVKQSVSDLEAKMEKGFKELKELISKPPKSRTQTSKKELVK